jgi:hypothetical protein
MTDLTHEGLQPLTEAQAIADRLDREFIGGVHIKTSSGERVVPLMLSEWSVLKAAMPRPTADGPRAPSPDWAKDPRTWALVLLLIECRDALPAITLASARLHGVDLNLGRRIESALKPWEAKEGEAGV